MEQSRRNWLTKTALAIGAITFARLTSFASSNTTSPNKSKYNMEDLHNANDNLKLGAFSVSLNVKDLNASKQFYASLGFKVFGGDMKKNYLIMKNGNALIGLFYGMFDKTILTFNPGWDENATKLESFDDVRDIQKKLKSKGITLLTEADEKTSGPASIMVMDPDGNQILIDQHV
ncbi:MAG TPA: VOC family protein [Flavisolibacter sp.]|nr:VOC family protein [Flavisolibacter sp.]